MPCNKPFHDHFLFNRTIYESVIRDTVPQSRERL